MKHYYITGRGAGRGAVEVTESEYLSLMGDDTTRSYAMEVYRNQLTIEEVPEDIREAVAAVVAEKVNRWGLYSERELTAHEALNIITGGNANEAN